MNAYNPFTRDEPSCMRSPPPGTRFFRIPGFNDVVVKAVPKGSLAPPPFINEIPSNTRLSVVGSYLGTDSIDKTYHALLRANNLFKTGILAQATAMQSVPSYPFVFENNRMSSSYPKAPVSDIIGPKPFTFDVPADHGFHNTPLYKNPLLPSAPGYSYTRIHSNDFTAHQAEDIGIPPISVVPRNPEKYSFGPSASHFAPHSYNENHFRIRMQNYGRPLSSNVLDHEKDFSVSKPLKYGVQLPRPNSFLYKQTSNDGKVTYYSGSEMNTQTGDSTNRKQNVTIHDSNLPLANRFSFPVPNGFVQIPSVESSASQKPIKPPSASGTNLFQYKQVDGSITSYGGEGTNDNDRTPKPEKPTVQGSTRVFESPINTDPFPVDINTNAFKPSSPVSNFFSYKLLKNGQVDYHYETGRDEASLTPKLEGNERLPVSSSYQVPPAPVTGYVESNSQSSPNTTFGQSSSVNKVAIPQRNSYTQTGYPQPNPFLTVNVNNPAMTKSNSQEYNSNTFQNHNEAIYHNSEKYVYIPPARNDEEPTPVKPMNLPKSPPKQFSNRFLYQNFDEYNSKGETFYLPPSTPKPQESSANNFNDKDSLELIQYNRKSGLSDRHSVTSNLVVIPEPVSTPKLADNVFVDKAPVQVPFKLQPSSNNRNNYLMTAPEQVSIPSSPVKISSTPQSSFNQNPLNSNPITVQPKTSFSFKQSNADGSSITTTNDGKTMSVQVEAAREPAAVQDEESQGNVEETPIPVRVNETSSINSVPVVVEEATTFEPEASTSMSRRRIMKRVKVKQRGDIPEDDWSTYY